jgi:hypothetical protein
MLVPPITSRPYHGTIYLLARGTVAFAGMGGSSRWKNKWKMAKKPAGFTFVDDLHDPVARLDSGGQVTSVTPVRVTSTAQTNLAIAESPCAKNDSATVTLADGDGAYTSKRCAEGPIETTAFKPTTWTAAFLGQRTAGDPSYLMVVDL